MSRKPRRRGSVLGALVSLALCAAPAACGPSAGGARPPGSAGLELTIAPQSGGPALLSAPVSAGAVLEFEWIHSVEHFSWFERFDVAADGSLSLRQARIGGFGAGVPYERGTSARVEDGYVVYDGMDETYPVYRWINSSTATAAITVDGRILVRGSDLPHHEALELRIRKRR